MDRSGKQEPALRFQINTDTLARRMGDETVLINLKTNRIFSLNPTASRLWELLAAGEDRVSIEQAMLSEFEVTKEQLDGEIRELLTSLIDENFISPIDEH